MSSTDRRPGHPRGHPEPPRLDRARDVASRSSARPTRRSSTRSRTSSSVLLRPNGDVVAQAEGIPVFLGSMHQTLGAGARALPARGRCEQGDVFISNDPYIANGTHKNDINILRPIFCGRRARLLRGHEGALDRHRRQGPGQLVAGRDATPTRRAYRSRRCASIARASCNEELLEMILAYTRLRENNEGDLHGADLGRATSAEVRTRELLARYIGRRRRRLHRQPLRLCRGAGARRDREDPRRDVHRRGLGRLRRRRRRAGARCVVARHRCGQRHHLRLLATASRSATAPAAMRTCVNTVAACRVAMKCLFGPRHDGERGLLPADDVVTTAGHRHASRLPGAGDRLGQHRHARSSRRSSSRSRP